MKPENLTPAQVDTSSQFNTPPVDLTPLNDPSEELTVDQYMAMLAEMSDEERAEFMANEESGDTETQDEEESASEEETETPDDSSPDEDASDEAGDATEPEEASGDEAAEDEAQGQTPEPQSQEAVESYIKEQFGYQSQELAQVVNQYRQLDAALQTKEGLTQLIQNLQALQLEQYGPQTDLPGEPVGIDVDNLTEESKEVYNALKSIHDRELRQFQQASQEKIDRLTEVVNDLQQRFGPVQEQAALISDAKLVNSKVPGANVSAEQLADMKQETGISDPVAAYKTYMYDRISTQTPAKATAKATSPKPAAPRGDGNANVLDANDPSVTADDIIRAINEGRPVKNLVD